MLPASVVDNCVESPLSLNVFRFPETFFPIAILSGLGPLLTQFPQPSRLRRRKQEPKLDAIRSILADDMAPTTSPSLRITLDDLTHQNIGVLKKLNTVLFPVPYSEKFYKESLSVGELAKLGGISVALPSTPFWLRD